MQPQWKSGWTAWSGRLFAPSFKTAKRLSTWSAQNHWHPAQRGKREGAPELIAVGDLSRLLFGVVGLLELVMAFLDFGAGLRRGELAGIRWEDIDFGLGQLLPKRSIVHQHIGPTKTEASQKPIPRTNS